jgi:hypothetical protein
LFSGQEGLTPRTEPKNKFKRIIPEDRCISLITFFEGNFVVIPWDMFVL